MRYMAARELEVGGVGTGKFHYTQLLDGVISPVGYCAGWQPWMEGPIDGFAVREELLAKERSRLFPFRAKFHTDGHSSAEEACSCYRQFLLDIRTRYDTSLVDEQRRCQVCGVWSAKMACVDGTFYYVLCDEHRTESHLSTLFKVG